MDPPSPPPPNSYLLEKPKQALTLIQVCYRQRHFMRPQENIRDAAKHVYPRTKGPLYPLMAW